MPKTRLPRRNVLKRSSIPRCGYMGCPFASQVGFINDHESQCEHHKMNCKHCGINIIKGDLKQHYKAYPNVVIACPYCKNKLQRKDKSNHICAKIVNERFTNFKEGNYSKRNKLIEKNFSNQQEQMKLLNLKQSQQIQELQEEVLRMGKNMKNLEEEIKSIRKKKQTSKFFCSSCGQIGDTHGGYKHRDSRFCSISVSKRITYTQHK
jgi:hypothetical protein